MVHCFTKVGVPITSIRNIDVRTGHSTFKKMICQPVVFKLVEVVDLVFNDVM